VSVLYHPGARACTASSSLAIPSSNAFSTGMAALALNGTGRLLKVSKLVYALDGPCPCS
jgi:histidine ammonia-lyase